MHRIKLRKGGKWEYVQRKLTEADNTISVKKEKLDNPQEDMSEELGTPVMVLLTKGDATTIKHLANIKSVENHGLRVQTDRQCTSQLGERKKKVEEWIRKI